MIGNGFKYIWSGGCKAENDVGVTVANWLTGKDVGIEMYNDRVMKGHYCYLGCCLGGSILLFSVGW